MIVTCDKMASFLVCVLWGCFPFLDCLLCQWMVPFGGRGRRQFFQDFARTWPGSGENGRRAVFGTGKRVTCDNGYYRKRRKAVDIYSLPSHSVRRMVPGRRRRATNDGLSTL
jgi:hypothetical protein